MAKKHKYNEEELPSTNKWVAENFAIGSLIGCESTLYKAEKDKSVYALKEIGQAMLAKFLTLELKIMSELGGRNNVIKMFGGHRDRGRVFVVMEYFHHDDFKTILPRMTTHEKLFYFKNLLIALEHLHSANIIHRDVKPGNFLYNRHHRRFALIDFGLSQEYRPKTVAQQKRRLVYGRLNQPPAAKRKKIYNCRCNDDYCCATCLEKPEKRVNKGGTPGFRPPEILLRFAQETQSTAIDIWSAGILLLSLLFKRHPLFRPSDDFRGICQIASILGSESITSAAERNGTTVRLPRYPGVDIGKIMNVVRPGWTREFQSELNCSTCRKLIFANTKGRCFCKKTEEKTNETLDPVTRLLVHLVHQALDPDPSTRRTATSLLIVIKDFENFNPGCFDY